MGKHGCALLFSLFLLRQHFRSCFPAVLVCVMLVFICKGFLGGNKTAYVKKEMKNIPRHSLDASVGTFYLAKCVFAGEMRYFFSAKQSCGRAHVGQDRL